MLVVVERACWLTELLSRNCSWVKEQERAGGDSPRIYNPTKGCIDFLDSAFLVVNTFIIDVKRPQEIVGVKLSDCVS